MHIWPTMHAYIYVYINILGDFNLYLSSSLSLSISIVGGQQHTCMHFMRKGGCASNNVCAHSIDLVLINCSTQIKKLYFNSQQVKIKP